ncbi:MAG: GNAT family N-acetyltransferase [Kiloniellales bacterium]
MTEFPRPIASGDIDWVLALNRLHETELSPLTRDALQTLIDRAFYARAIGSRPGDGAAFLLAFDQDAAYDSPNFLWFKERLGRFVYVDRIAVAASARGRGLARTLYHDLFQAALAAGQEAVVCEVNLEPPNPGSDAFHAALGFSVVGRAQLADRGKSVRYLQRTLP